MIRPALAASACVGLALTFASVPTRGEEYNHKNLFEKVNEQAGKPDGRVHTYERAGYSGPDCLRRHTQPSKEPHYLAGYVGGGSLLRKHRLGGGPEPGPAMSEGTFGWDYVGLGRFPKRIFLGWSNSRYYRHLIPGPYDQGPRVRPEDIFADQPFKEKFRELGAEEEEEHGHAEEGHGEKGHGEDGHGEKGHDGNGHGEAGHGEGHAPSTKPNDHAPSAIPSTLPPPMPR
jgi:hypothetical protein